MSDAWLQRLAPRPDARARLFCFPYAGAGAAVYRTWAQFFPAEIEVCAVQLPGRGGRFGEKPIASIPALVDALRSGLKAHLDRPFAFFGHSMGAVLAHELTRALHAAGEPLPKHLFVSGRRAPGIADPDAPLRFLSDQDFVAHINVRYGGIPQEILQNQDVLALLLPSLRADITALETFRSSGGSALPVSLTVYGGDVDPRTLPQDLPGWRAETAGDFRLRMFPGGHFYLDAQRAELLADLWQTLQRALGPSLPNKAIA